MKKILSFLLIIFVSIIAFASADVERVNFSKKDISTKRILFTDTWLPNGVPVLDINNNGNMLMYSNFRFPDVVSDTEETLYSTFYTSNWSGYADQCTGALTNIVTITGSIPEYFTGMTTYIFDEWTYDLLTWITLLEDCTVLQGSWEVELDWSWFNNVISITWSKYNIVEWLKLKWNIAWGYNWIVCSYTNSNTFNDIEIINYNRWFYVFNCNNLTLNNTKTYNWVIWFSLWGVSSYNYINNSISFNNSQHWFSINAWYLNVVNNSLIFNNKIYGFLIQVWTGNLLSNSIIFNNKSNWTRIIAWNYINESNIFNNVWNVILANSTWYGLIKAEVLLPVGLKFWLSTDNLVSEVWFDNWYSITNIVVSEDELVLPYDENWTALFNILTGYSDWKDTHPFTWFISRIDYGKNVQLQIQPVKYKSDLSKLEDTSSYTNKNKITSLTWYSQISSNDSGNVTINFSDTPKIEFVPEWIKADWFYIWTGLKIVNSGNRVSLQYLSGTDWIEQ